MVFAISGQRFSQRSLTQALSDYREPPSTDDLVLPVPEASMPDSWHAADLSALRVAAVLVAFYEDVDGVVQVILTERAHHLLSHPGQISFPGGAEEPEDAALAHVALREAEEEVSLPRDSVAVLGYMKPQWTISGYSMTPVIGFVDHAPVLTADPGEVASVFSVPAEYLFDPKNHTASERMYQGKALPVVDIVWQQHRIWGATAHVITRLSSII